MKIKLSCCIILAALAGSSVLAGPNLQTVTVTSNTIIIAHHGNLAAKETVLLGGIPLSWQQPDKETVIAKLPEKLKAGSYTLQLKGHPAFEVSIGAGGQQGPAGTDGAVGPQGPAGMDGAMGPQGLPGKDAGLVNNFITAYYTGVQQVTSQNPVQFSSVGATSGEWFPNGMSTTTFTIPATGIYQVSIMLINGGWQNTCALELVDSPNSLANQVVDLSYFQFYDYAPPVSWQVIVSCTVGDMLSLNSVGADFSIGSPWVNGSPWEMMRPNAPSATITILQIK